MTSQFDGYESDTLFNSMQEDGQGIFSLMVDPKTVIEVADTSDSSNHEDLRAERAVTVGQKIHLSLSERSVSPAASDVTVTWSNGAKGLTYEVSPEDLGTTLTATAFFAGQDMKPLEVTIECGPVVLAPAPELDRARVIVAGALPADASAPNNGVREHAPVYMYLPASAFSPAVESVDVVWNVGGEPVERLEALSVEELTDCDHLARVREVLAAREESRDEDEPHLEEIPTLLAEFFGARLIATNDSPLSAQALQALERMAQQENSREVIAVAPRSVPEIAREMSKILSSGAQSTVHQGMEPLLEDEAANVQNEDPDGTLDAALLDESTESHYFVAEFIPPVGSAGQVLTVEITARLQGAQTYSGKLNAGLIGNGESFTLRDDVAVRVAEPRVGEEAWAKVKKRDFEPVADHLSYQWLLNGRELEEATSSTIEVTPMMRGRELSVLIEARGAAAVPSTVEASLGVVGLGDAPEYLGEPLSIKGKPKVGNTVKVANFERDFLLPSADSIEFQWMRGKDPIRGARSQSYTIELQDVDEKLWARVLVRKTGHATTVLKTPKVKVQ